MSWFNNAIRHLEQTDHLIHYPKSQINEVEKTLFYTYPPLLNTNTNSTDDVSHMLDVLHMRLIQNGKSAMLLYADEQLLKNVWSLKCGNPDNYRWIVPFPGEFHFLYHVTHAIFRLFSPFLLSVANLISRSNITEDFLSSYWYKQEDFLILVIEAIHQWLLKLRGIEKDNINFDILEIVKNNEIVYYVLYFYWHFGLFYWNLRQSIRKGVISDVKHAWKYAWPLFSATNKTNYTKLSLIATYLDNFTCNSIKILLDNRLCNITGMYGRGIPPDLLTEKVIANLVFLKLAIFYKISAICA